MDEYVTERVTREHLTLVGPLSESKAVLIALGDAGYEVHRSGPFTDREMFPKHDMSRFLIRASRPIG